MVLDNKSGQVLLVKIMLAIVLLIGVMGISRPLIENVNLASNSTDMNCTSTTLTYTQSATCTVLDFIIFYMIGIGISIGMSFIAGSKNAGGIISAITIFVVVTVLINPLKELIVAWRGVTFLNCSGAGISIANKLACIIADAWLFWFVAIAISAAVVYIFVKKVLPGE